MAQLTAAQPLPLGAVGPIALTAARLAIAVAVLPVGWMSPRLPAWALVLYGLGAVTDALDGLLARKAAACTRVGAALDLLADKVWVVFALAILVHHGVLGAAAPVAIVLREVAVTLRRRQLAHRGLHLPPTPRSRAKTVIQMLTLWVLLADPALPGRTAVIWAVAGYTWACGLELLLRRPIRREARHA